MDGRVELLSGRGPTMRDFRKLVACLRGSFNRDQLSDFTALSAKLSHMRFPNLDLKWEVMHG